MPPVDEEVLELDDNIRKTEKMSASHFRAMLGPTAMLSSLPPIPSPPIDTLSPPIQHEELASSTLIEQALAQIKAGARIRLDSEDDLEKLRADPSTIPRTMRQVSEIEAKKEARPALAMAPLARPAEGPAPEDLPRITTPTGEIIELTKPVPQLQRMQRIVREPPVEPKQPPRSDARMISAVIVLIVCAFATIALLLVR